jgi:hypothetical protein
MARRSPPRKVTYFEPVLPRLARNTIIESKFEVGRRFRCTMRVDCGQLDPAAVIRPELAEWHPRMPKRLDEEELADWRAGRDAVYQLAALTVGARLAVVKRSTSRTWRIAVLSAGIRSPVQKPKERTLIGPAEAPSNRARSSRNAGRNHLGMPGEIISEHRAKSSRNTGRNHLGTPSEIKSECWATSSRIRGRLAPESAKRGLP